MRRDDWIEVASGSDLPSARQNFLDWLERVGLTESQLQPKDVRIDTIRGKLSDRRRIMVRRDLIP